MNIGLPVSSLSNVPYGKPVPLTGENGEPVQLAEGDTVAAEIIEIRPDGVLTLRTADGRQFLAELLADRTLVPGQRVALTVTAVRDGVPMVEITGEGVSSAETFLKAMNAPVNDLNLALAREAILQQALFTPKQFAALAKAAAAFGIEPEQAVFMAKHNIPVNSETAAQYQTVTQPESQLGALLQKLLDLLPPGRREDRAGGGDVFRYQTSERAETPMTVVSATQPGGDAPQAGTVRQPAAPQTPAVQPAVQSPQVQPFPAPEAAAEPQTEQPVPNLQNTQAEAPVQPAPQGQSSMSAEPAPVPQSVSIGDAVPQPSVLQSPIPQTSVSQTVQEPIQTGSSAPQAADNPAQSVPPRQMADQPQMRQAAQTEPPVSREPVQAAPAESAQQTATEAPSPTLSSLLNSVRQEPLQAETLSPQAEPHLRELLDALFARVSPGRARELPRELDAPRLTREVGQLLVRALETAREMSGQLRTELLRTAREIVQTLRFSEQLNHCAAYTQIPLTINGERTTAQLYVFNDSREKKKIDPRNATLFLSLKTANLGTVEGFVKVIGTGVEGDFSLQTEEAARLFRAGIPELSGRLEARGYRLERVTAAVTREEPLPPAAVEKGRAVRAERYRFNRTV
ncbi:MAG: flagellar hook-length control protein FliK [Oscillospiraceae bacterium]|jgi:hypothetical protein|nr:flagellar hook-length control protein FliK [Oscillospiraceae bacterium]